MDIEMMESELEELNQPVHGPWRVRRSTGTNACLERVNTHEKSTRDVAAAEYSIP